MNFKATIKSLITSYGSVLTGMITGLITIRLATHHFSREEFGLWNFTMQTVGYFLMLEFGMSGSGTRLLGEPLAKRDQEGMNRWFTLSVIALSVQALAIFMIGLALRPWVLNWFEIPSHLLDIASLLWISFLAIQASALVFKLSFAILYAQNRVYWTNALQTAGLCITLAAFAVMLKLGAGLMSYVWAAAIGTMATSLGGIAAVMKGQDRFRICFKSATMTEMMRMFRFSGAVFFVGLSAQVYMASQGLVATKILGLEAASMLAVTMRSSVMATQFVWRPFDAFSPRWQIAYCEGARSRVADEFGMMIRATLLLAVLAACAIIIFNRPFVVLWTKPEFFGGMPLTILSGIVLVIQSISRCYAAPFILTMKLRAYIWVTIGSVLVGVSLMTIFSSQYGIAGIAAGTLVTDLLFPLWFYIAKGGSAILSRGHEPLVKDIGLWLTTLVFCITSMWMLSCWHIDEKFQIALGCLIFVTAMLLTVPRILQILKMIHQNQFKFVT